MKRDFGTVSQRFCFQSLLRDPNFPFQKYLIEIGGFELYWPLTHAKSAYRLAGPVAYKWYPSGRHQSHAHCIRVAASRMQNVPAAWPPRIKSKGICLRLAATRVQFACDWLPQGKEIIYSWAQVAYYIFTCNWRPQGYNLYATGRQIPLDLLYSI